MGKRKKKAILQAAQRERDIAKLQREQAVNRLLQPVPNTASVVQNLHGSVTHVKHPVKQSNGLAFVQPATPNQNVPSTVTTTPGRAAVTQGLIDVDSTNAARLLIAQPQILADASPGLWHKVIVKTPVTDKIAVITAINRRISPLKLTPYFFTMEDGHITFLVSNCSAPLAILCRQNLKIPFNSGNFHEIELSLKLHAMKINLSEKMQKILSKRLDSEKKILDFSGVRTIPEFLEMVYNPTDISHLLQLAMEVVSVMAPNLLSLSLARNELSSLNYLKDIFANRTKWRSLKVLDVTHNKITSISELAIFGRILITELHLHRNPVCGKYKEDHSYISVIRVVFPNLIKLDGTYLQHTPGLPYWRPNYIFCASHSDSGQLADQFVEHYFTLFDGDDRMWLRGLYHDNAYFSLSSMYLSGQSTSTNARLTSYMTESRNLLHSTSKLKTKAALSRGAKNVLAKLTKLPRTQHDPSSFTVDLLHHSLVRTILTVTGVFRDQNLIQKMAPRHFMRTFILLAVANDEYKIINDIMYVTNATTREAEEAFRYTRPRTKLKKSMLPLTKVTEGDKDSMTKMFSQLTDTTAEWSRKMLGNADWDMRKAVQAFIALYNVDKIPQVAFTNPKRTTCNASIKS